MEQRTSTPRTSMGRVATAAVAVALVGLAVLAVPAGAQSVPTASAAVECRDGAGWIIVTIETEFESSFQIEIDGAIVSPFTTVDPPGAVDAFGPYADGDHTVVVEWDGAILDTVVNVDCEPEPTSSSTTSTTAALAPTSTIAPQPVVVAPTYTG